MSAPDRETLRAALAALLEATETWQAVYTSQPKTFEGQSPVATVHNGPARFEFLAAGHAPQAYFYQFVVTNYARRGPDDDEATAEAQMDALLMEVLDVVDTHRREDEWTLLEIVGASAPDYYIVDGVQYRAEAVTLEAMVRL